MLLYRIRVTRARVLLAASFLSLLLCAAATGIWLGSYVGKIFVTYTRPAPGVLSRAGVVVVADRVQCFNYTETEPPTQRLPDGTAVPMPAGAGAGWNWGFGDQSGGPSAATFGWRRYNWPTGTVTYKSQFGWTFVLPWWPAPLITLLPPVLWSQRWRRERRQRLRGFAVR